MDLDMMHGERDRGCDERPSDLGDDLALPPGTPSRITPPNEFGPA
jgi:hypothetical protein